MTTRTDIHRPSAIQPENYEFVACHYIGSSDGDLGMVLANKEARQQIRNHMDRTGGKYSNHSHGGTCHICGATALYLAVYYHAETNSYISTGEDCARKMDFADIAAFNPLRRAIADARSAKAGKNKAKMILSEAGLDAAWELFDKRPAAAHGDEEALATFKALKAVNRTGGWYSEVPTICDIVSKLVKYGSISDRQENFLRGLLERLANRERIEAERAAERAAAADCPEGRVEITGTIVKTDWKESYNSCRQVMTVKADEGFLVWGTQPGSITDAEKGDRVTFTATVTKSDRDEKFGFYKRPTGAKVLEEAATE